MEENVLLLKATSEAAVHTVKDCLALIKLQQQQVLQSATRVGGCVGVLCREVVFYCVLYLECPLDS